MTHLRLVAGALANQPNLPIMVGGRVIQKFPPPILGKDGATLRLSPIRKAMFVPQKVLPTFPTWPPPFPPRIVATSSLGVITQRNWRRLMSVDMLKVLWRLMIVIAHPNLPPPMEIVLPGEGYDMIFPASQRLEPIETQPVIQQSVVTMMPTSSIPSHLPDLITSMTYANGWPTLSSLQEKGLLAYPWRAADHLTREERQLFTTNTLSIMWTPGMFANYRRANPCVEDFVITQFCGDPSSPDDVLKYWNDSGIMLGQATMFVQSYNHRATAQTQNTLWCSTCQGTEAPSSNVTPVALTSIQGNWSNEASHSTGVDDPMGEWVNYGNDDDSDISLSEKAQSLGRMGMAFTVVATAARLIPPIPENIESGGNPESHMDDGGN
ncbi:hypothetical protein JAAARDRAFT_187417 [Jaapia argillacea MUCL 33604]|uniref:Uncharacterized protein n=1 Tax=Jaapia argillacea MUCL 33604 TaxID=933084 RepID=A0A067QAE7_9AGAM|nr:hypothetical protein JAAARDRAFT_187417 [Jaapia argillacea MUCL 33604]